MNTEYPTPGLRALRVHWLENGKLIFYSSSADIEQVLREKNSFILC